MTEEIPISEIKISNWDARENKEKDKDIEDLMRSIEHDGLLSPITVTSTNSEYLLIAGRRRLNACKLLGKTTIPAHIVEDKTETQKRRATLMENLNRKELSEIEKALGILAIYESEGYQGDDAIKQLKMLYNEGYKVKETNYDELEARAVRKGLLWFPTRKFVKICETIGQSPNTQYQWLQLTQQIDRKVLETAQKMGLKRDKMTLLTNKKLRPHSRLQIHLAKRMASLSDSESRELVYQMMRDLETGALEQSGQGWLLSDAKRDKLGKNVALNPVQYYLRIMSELKKLFFLFTDRAISRGEYKYTHEMITQGKNHRLKILKSLGYRELRILGEEIQLLSTIVNDLQRGIDRELDEREQKEELTKQ
jgi:hypothetical protein